MLDDIDAITPCPITRPPTSPDALRTLPTPPSSLRSSIDSSRRLASIKAVEEGTDGDLDRLWSRMLSLQQKYGCYNSARMSAALSSETNMSTLRPSKACLDLLNENMTMLPESVMDWLRPN